MLPFNLIPKNNLLDYAIIVEEVYLIKWPLSVYSKCNTEIMTVEISQWLDMQIQEVFASLLHFRFNMGFQSDVCLQQQLNQSIFPCQVEMTVNSKAGISGLVPPAPLSLVKGIESSIVGV